MTAPKRYPTSLRMSGEAAALTRALAARLGVSQAAVIEMAIRKFAESEGVAVPRENAA